MKIDELISELEDVKEEHGNAEVSVGYSGWRDDKFTCEALGKNRIALLMGSAKKTPNKLFFRE